MNYYHSPTFGKLTIEGVKEQISTFMKNHSDGHYQVIIGSDSQRKNGGSETDFVTAIIVHRIGAGGIYFWKRMVDHRPKALKQRILEEAVFSITTAQEFFNVVKSNGILKFDFEIHIDMGQNGPTREWISEVVGMVRNSGFRVKTKPDAFGASKVADRHT